MKQLGLALIIAGVLFGIAAVNYDTSVATGLGSRVHNIGLMQQQQTHLIVAAVAVIIGVILYSLKRSEQQGQRPGSRAQTKSPSTADEIAKLALLKQTGALTEQEFVREKQKLLGDLQPVIAEVNSIGTLHSPALKNEWAVKTDRECMEALAGLGYTVRQIRQDAWEVSSPTGKSASYAYSLANLRKITAREVALRQTSA